MAKQLVIKKVHDASYITLRKATDNFQKPVICTLSENDRSRVQELKTDILDFEENYKNQILNSNDNFNEFYNAVAEYSPSKGEDDRQKEYDSSNLFIFLTKDKVISPIDFGSDRYTSTVEHITKLFFSTSFFKERLTDSSIIKKVLIFASLKKGIFGKFRPSNLSNVVNINTWYSHGGTNTSIHADHGLSNLFLQMEGMKRWWIASPFQRKDILQEVFNCDSTALNLNDSFFGEFEYYDFELKKEEILYLPTNWLHGVVAPKGLNLSLSFRFPMGIREALSNIIYWESIGVPLNNLKKSAIKENKSLADVRAEQAEAFNELKFFLRKHKFSSREILNEEPEFVSGLYDIDRLNKAITGAE